MIKILFSLFMALLLGSPVISAETQTDDRQLYINKCGNCHGADGKGFLRVYPPIHDSRFLKQDVKKLPCIIQNGLQGELDINGTVFNQVMPGTKSLTPDQIAELIQFMQKQWNHPLIPLQVEQLLSQCENSHLE